MNDNPLLKLEALGQSIWLDYISREIITSGTLEGYIKEDGLRGITSNPSIFEKAFAGSDDYDKRIYSLTREGKSVEDIFWVLALEDVQEAARLFLPVYDRLNRKDGYVSLEVSPLLAHDTQGTIEEARRLWKNFNRPNAMVKVPATREGLPAIRQLIGEGININITLLFGLPRYREVVDAYFGGLEILAAQGKPIDHSHSVASFFLSRIDVLLDPILEKLMQVGTPRQKELAQAAHGEVAIASAKVAYEIYHELFGSERFHKLAAKGAMPQRLLWASTSTKNPDYPDVKYVEALIGPETIDTIPVETLHEYKDHGKPDLTLDKDIQKAHQVLDSLTELGIHIDQVTQQLEDEGVAKFDKAFDQLLSALKDKRAALVVESGID
jgi:transaldolase